MAKEKNTEQPATDDTMPVNINNAVRAETDHMIRVQIENFGLQFGKITHLREPMTPENQSVIRVNQDTLYSSTVIDVSKPVTITLPILIVMLDDAGFGQASTFGGEIKT